MLLKHSNSQRQCKRCSARCILQDASCFEALCFPPGLSVQHAQLGRFEPRVLLDCWGPWWRNVCPEFGLSTFISQMLTLQKNGSNIHSVGSDFPVPLLVYILGLAEGIMQAGHTQERIKREKAERLRQPDIICETLLLQRVTWWQSRGCWVLNAAKERCPCVGALAAVLCVGVV